MSIVFTLLIALTFFWHSILVQAVEIASPPEGLKTLEGFQAIGEMVEEPKKMSQTEIDELLGEDPYLGQTSWLGGKEGG